MNINFMIYFFLISLVLVFSQIHAEKIIFGQSCPLTGPAKDLGWGMYYGIKAAFEEQNQLGGIDGLELELIAKDDGYEPDRALQNTQEFVSNTSIFALIGEVGTPTSALAFPVAAAAEYPFIGAFTGAGLLRFPFSKYAVNFRASYRDETASMVEFLVSEGINRISLMIQNDSFGLSGKEGVDIGLASHNMRLFSEGSYERNTELIEDGLYAIEYNTQDPLLNPQAIIMIGAYNPLAKFVIEAKKKWPDIYYLTVSFVGSESFAEQLAILAQDAGISDWNKNVIITQCVPLPTDTSIEAVTRYQTALRNYNSSIVPGFVSLEGYLVARMVIDTLNRIPGHTFSRQIFLDTIYDAGNYNLNNLRCGPFLPHGREFFGESDGCNQCMRQIWGTEMTKDKRFIENTDVGYSFSTCGYRPKAWEYLRFGLSINTQDDYSKMVINGIKAAFRMLNDQGGIHGKMMFLNVTDHGNNKTQSIKNTENFDNDPKIFGLLGYSDEMSINETLITKRNIPMIGFMSGLDSLRHPFIRNVINIRISFVEEAAIMTTLLTDQGLRGISVVQLNSHISKDGMEGVTMSLGSVREVIRSQARLMLASNDSAMLENIRTALDTIESTSDNGKDLEGVILLTSENLSVTIQLLLEGRKRWPDIPIVLSNSFFSGDTIGSKIIESLDNNSISIEKIISKVYLTQAVPSFNDEGMEITNEYQKAMKNLDRTTPLSTISFESYLSARLLIDVIGRTSGSLTRETLLNSFYIGSRFRFDEISIGPYQDEIDNACNHGMNTVWLKRVSSNGSLVKLWDGTYSLPVGQCGYVTIPQYDFKLYEVRAVPFQLSIIMIIFIAVVLVLLIRNRMHYVIKPGLIFSIISGFGLIMTLCINLIAYYIPNRFTCAFMPWAIHTSFAITFAPLFAKTHRIAKLFYNPSMKVVRIKDKDLYQMVLAICFYFTLLMIFWSAFQGLPEFQSAFLSDGTRYETCFSTNSGPSVLCLVSEIILLGWGTLLCNQVNDISGEFRHLNESKSIGICIYNAIVFGLLIMAINFALELEPNLTYILNSIIILLNALVATIVLFIAKLMKAHQRKTAAISRASFSGNEPHSISPGSSPKKPSSQSQS